MKKMRLHIFIVMAVFVILFIVGSFLDLQISNGLYQHENGFGIAVAALSMNVGYGVLAFMGGVSLYHAHKLEKVNYMRVLTFLMALGFFGCAVYFDGKEFFGPNGWYNPDIYFLGFIIAVPLMGACSFGGYLVGKKANNPRLWLLMLIGAAFIALSLVIGTTVVKNIFHRPRYRTAVVHEEYLIGYYPWWKRCGNYKDLMDKYGILKEEFKSFPSGHTSVCAMTMLFVIILPFIQGKELKHQVLYFYLGFAYAALIAFTRILTGAHYLSDVAMGGLITTICLYIYYEIVLHNPKLYENPSLEVVEDGSDQ